MRSQWVWLVSAILIGQCCGCGGGGGGAVPKETLVPVTGKVRFGGTPTEGIRVLFTPAGSTVGNGGYATTDAEGNFELLHTRTNEKGVSEGEYVVTFSRFVKPDGSPVPPGQSPVASGGNESIPPKWSEVPKAGKHNSITVRGDSKPLEFAIPKS